MKYIGHFFVTGMACQYVEADTILQACVCKLNEEELNDYAIFPAGHDFITAVRYFQHEKDTITWEVYHELTRELIIPIEADSKEQAQKRLEKLTKKMDFGELYGIETSAYVSEANELCDALPDEGRRSIAKSL